MDILHQLWMDELYTYVVTFSGLDVIDLDSCNKVSYIELENVFTTIWGNEDTIYLGTSVSGIKYINKASIIVNESDSYNLISYLNDYDYYYKVSSNIIKYIHGYYTTLAVVTSSGIDILNNDYHQGYKSTIYNANIVKCFMTSNLELYYVIQDSVDNGIFKINYLKCDWQIPSVSYSVNNSFLPVDSYINDIFVTVATSVNNVDNILFVATTSGVYVYDEGSAQYDFYNTGTLPSLAGTSNNIVSVKADYSTNRFNGKMYVISSGIGAALSILDLGTKVLSDQYTLTLKGRANKVLIQDNVRDLMISY